ncbi:LysR family transcriptional regulator [Ancylobacter dichloromethanicus]|uniref:LysR family transcriptional regulator n=1 Tax=Ancylobacter dichloromethanicus TaxID=518825 RepID=A0A9W6JAP9_9HYPH|nr:LysR family transcriptional regulator [Ancylobacter dichloromethanicus]MBS7552334.1 LysR family transcriptional regulator [Ancylobacter dichloromethanicus]GLK74070.1 LysR family transcriptional regulator [Ancylobacter dichloromethanicus]
MSPPDTLPFDLRALEIFLAVCDAGTMAQAARRLGLTQPAISQAVADLERRIGITLFDRGARPLGLTAAGGALRQRASALLSEARQIAPLLREAEHARLPLLRAGLVDSLSRVLMAPLARALGEKAEQVSLQSGLTASHAGALLTRQLDLLVGADDLDEIEGLERWPLLSEPYVLLLPSALEPPASTGALEALAGAAPLVRFSARSKTGIEVERHLRRLRLDLPRPLEFDTPYGVTAAVAEGAGFAVTTPLCLLEAGVSLHGLACHPLPGPGLTRHLTLIARRQELGRLPREVAAFCRQRLAAQRGTLAALVGETLAGEFTVEG